MAVNKCLNFVNFYDGIDVQPSTEELADLNLEGRTCVWRLGHKYEFDYKLPYDNNGEAKEYTIDVFNSKKRLIYALGDLHIGGTWSNGMESKLEAYLNKIMAKANDEVMAIELAGLPKFTIYNYYLAEPWRVLNWQV